MSIILILYTLNPVVPLYSYESNDAYSNVRLQGFEKDLHLRGEQYATTLSILFVGYIIMQMPGNMFLHWLERPSVIIPCCTFTISVLITTNDTGIVIACFFLGFSEAPFFPELLALVSCGSFLNFAFGSLFASAILRGMQDKIGQAAWRWLFYVEGGITILVVVCAMFILPDFPHNTRWFTPEESTILISRHVEDGYGVVAAVVGQCFFAYFPTPCAKLGYNTTVTHLAEIRYSDKKQRRYKCFIVSNALGALAFMMSIFTMDKAARYTSLNIQVPDAARVTAGYLVLLGWISNPFFREPAKRAVATTLMNALGHTTYPCSYAVCIPALGVL
ncbi:major facilitator superfamily domain-containing protein [Suillus discolor]|uniref:Major facilitator superfamily domain-containing protein n=1 Tax=Suillus discolor TaxID=1912936 RepID=A0A9P7FJ98_9AGAM|nr:major facilitator superfamily domain-containing protein [Suillus discolor]KAG2118691.1 major facilitator superfamily domain-containing protein [Suillus discolor]